MVKLSAHVATDSTSGKVLVLHQSRISREALCELLISLGFTISGAGRTVADAARDITDGSKPDLLIQSLNSDAEAALALSLMKDARAAMPGLKAVVLTDCSQVEAVAAVMRAGVEAVLSQEISADVLKRSLELVLLGQRMFPAGVVQSLLDPLPPSEAGRAGGSSRVTAEQQERAATGTRRTGLLSAREHQVMRCLIEGLPNKLIAKELDITEATVKVHIKGVLRKTQLANRTQVAIWALNNRIWNGPPADPASAGPEMAPVPPREPDAHDTQEHRGGNVLPLRIA